MSKDECLPCFGKMTSLPLSLLGLVGPGQLPTHAMLARALAASQPELSVGGTSALILLLRLHED